MMIVVLVGLLTVLGGILSPAVGQTPVARIYHSMVETNHGRIIVVAGNTRHGWSMDLYDVWAYELESNELTEVGGVEAGEVFGAYGTAYDRQSERIILLNREGETWALNPAEGTWEHRSPVEAPSRNGGRSSGTLSPCHGYSYPDGLSGGVRRRTRVGLFRCRF